MKNVSYKTEKAGGGASPQAAAPRRLLLKRLFALLFALSLGMQWAYAYDFSNSSGGNPLYYNIIDASNRYVEVTCPGTYSSPWSGYTKPTGAVNVPQTINHNNIVYTVTTIGSHAFDGCTGLTSVTLPNSLTTIGYEAFDGCSGLTSITLPNSVTTIGNYAFYGTNL